MLEIFSKCFDDVVNLVDGIFLLLDDGSLLVDVGLLGHLPRHELLHQAGLEVLVITTHSHQN